MCSFEIESLLCRNLFCRCCTIFLHCRRFSRTLHACPSRGGLTLEGVQVIRSPLTSKSSSVECTGPLQGFTPSQRLENRKTAEATHSLINSVQGQQRQGGNLAGRLTQLLGVSIKRPAREFVQWGVIGDILGLNRDNGKENGNYYLVSATATSNLRRTLNFVPCQAG